MPLMFLKNELFKEFLIIRRRSNAHASLLQDYSEKPLGSETSWSKDSLSTGRNQALNTSPVESTHHEQVAAEVPPPSLCLFAREERVHGAQDILLLYQQRSS